jgi:bifunctional N-acetylglucosamine-1-phosphate-uridyltransferase/glucosamine-1-phosphate-acetyltransferase GlmU-like protein
MKTLIIPCAGKSSRYPDTRPKYLLTHPDGKLMIEKVLSAMEGHRFDRIVITITKPHDEQYEARTILQQAFGHLPEVDICMLDNFTSSAVETIYQTILACSIEGQIIIRDSDNLVRYQDSGNTNFVVGLDLNHHSDVSNMRGKSYLIVNDQNLLVNIVEKNICSSIICLGVYSFESAASFRECFLHLHSQGKNGELYISHVISYLIGTGQCIFSYEKAQAFEDWGTLSDWMQVLEQHRTYIFDLDGVVFHNVGKYGSKNWVSATRVISENIHVLQALSQSNAQLIFMTSRPERLRQQVVDLLTLHQIRIHALIMDCNHAPRTLVNDFASSNPYPSATAISIERNGLLQRYIRLPAR